MKIVVVRTPVEKLREEAKNALEVAKLKSTENQGSNRRGPSKNRIMEPRVDSVAPKMTRPNPRETLSQVPLESPAFVFSAKTPAVRMCSKLSFRAVALDCNGMIIL